MKLLNGWYAITSTKSLTKNKPNALRCFGENYVVWRTPNNGWIAQSDHCPHRGAKLSGGWIENDCIVCPFHGLKFNAQGTCEHVPELDAKAPGIKVTTIPLTERHGLLWMPKGVPADTTHHIPWFDEIDDSFGYAWSERTWKTHFTRCVENQLDYAHLPFVHKTTIGRGMNVRRQPKMEFTSTSIKVILDPQRAQSGFFEFKFPNIWMLHIGHKLREFLVLIPVDEQTTRILLRKYGKWTPFHRINVTIAWLMRPFSNFILRQDKRIVLSQQPMDSTAAKSEILMPSDRAVAAFRDLLSR